MQPTGEHKPLAANSRDEYTDYVYKNQYSAVAEGRALSGVKTYDGYYLSFAEGYLCDEINHYSNLAYGSEAQYIIRDDDHSNDAVLKSGFELRKVVSTTGPGSPAPKLEGAGFTVYRVWDLSKVDEFQKMQTAPTMFKVFWMPTARTATTATPRSMISPARAQRSPGCLSRTQMQ